MAVKAGEAARATRVHEILHRVVQKQSAAKEDRNRWIFGQRALVRFLRSNGKLAREELRHYEVRPKVDGMERDLISLEGKVTIGKEVHPYSDPEYRSGKMDLDGELVDGFADDFLFEKGARDGLPKNLFPVSAEMVERHEFTLDGEEDYRGRQVFRITFVPVKKEGDRPSGWWKGEMLVDTETLQPLLVTTTQARGIPMAVRALLGINVKQMGFRLEYGEVAPGVWFPTRYSGEFSLRILFGYSRRIALSLHNLDFRKATAESSIQYEGEAKGDELEGRPPVQ
ncbi:MAG: hypothetical protein U5J83_12810 [Bryobacterales bacterium]|nr:hypothetical protein [Bryobacterales bacterium]